MEKAVPGVKVTFNASWNYVTSLGAGTGVFTLVEFQNLQQGSALIRFIKRKLGKRIFPLGGGTNIIGTDTDIKDTLFIRALRGGNFGELSYNPSYAADIVSAGSAVSLKNLLDYACTFSLGGFSGLCGIPGTIGGAIRMNAGANGLCVSDFLADFDALDLESGEIHRYFTKEFDWGYRRSSIPESLFIVSARFRFKDSDSEQEKNLLKKELHRRLNSPAGRSAGSVFMNPGADLPAGLLLDKCGAKTFSRGAFSVSGRHANWIVREPTFSGAASEKDFLFVFENMKKTVYNKTGIILKPEVRFAEMSGVKALDKDFRRLKILLLKGGVSSEREISLKSAANVASALREAGHDVVEYDIRELKLTPEMRQCDVVYPVLHGGFGEDGRLQELLEGAGIKFVGGGSEALRIVMDKLESKRVMKEHGIRTPAYMVVTNPAEELPDGMTLPLIVKPSNEGSTFGLSLVESESDWRNALAEAFKYDSKVLVEEFISGIEGTVGILLGRALPVIEIIFPGKFYDYDAKYVHSHGDTIYNCPPRKMSQSAQDEAKKLCEKYAEAVGGSELLRVDVIVRSSDDAVFVLEGNGLPGFTSTSLFPEAIKTAGISSAEMCSRLALNAFYGK